MKINELISDFGIWANSEEQALLDKLSIPVRLETLTPREQVCATSLIRKSLLKKIGEINPLVVKNEKYS